MRSPERLYGPEALIRGIQQRERCPMSTVPSKISSRSALLKVCEHYNTCWDVCKNCPVWTDESYVPENVTIDEGLLCRYL